MQGNAVYAFSRLGFADHPSTSRLVEALIGWQWPDGGWNCDRHRTAHRSSFHESVTPALGLATYAQLTGDETARAAADRTAELLLQHQLFRSRRTGEPIHPSWTRLHYPPYWHYDVLQALVVLDRAGCRDDPRTDRARRVVAAKQRKDGGWRAVRPWWRRPGSTGLVEAVDWGDVAHQMVTLNALRVTAPAAGRTPVRSRPSPAPPAGRPAR